MDVHVTTEKRKIAYHQKITATLHYRRKNTASFWFTASAKVVTAKNKKTANRLKITAVWQYRPACVRLKNRYRRPPGKQIRFTHLCCQIFGVNHTVLCFYSVLDTHSVQVDCRSLTDGLLPRWRLR